MAHSSVSPASLVLRRKVSLLRAARSQSGSWWMLSVRWRALVAETVFSSLSLKTCPGLVCDLLINKWKYTDRSNFMPGLIPCFHSPQSEVWREEEEGKRETSVLVRGSPPAAPWLGQPPICRTETSPIKHRGLPPLIHSRTTRGTGSEEEMLAELCVCHRWLSHEPFPSTQPPGTSGRLKMVEIEFIKTPKCLCNTTGQEAGIAKERGYNGERRYKREKGNKNTTQKRQARHPLTGLRK